MNIPSHLYKYWIIDKFSKNNYNFSKNDFRFKPSQEGSLTNETIAEINDLFSHCANETNTDLKLIIYITIMDIIFRNKDLFDSNKYATAIRKKLERAEYETSDMLWEIWLKIDFNPFAEWKRELDIYLKSMEPDNTPPSKRRKFIDYQKN